MRSSRLRRAAPWLLAGLLTALIAPGATAAKPKKPQPGQQVRADFNGDGRTDLAMADGKTEFATASSAEDVGGAQSAGAVNVVYGSKKGLTADGNQLFAQGQGGIPGTSGPFESFGIALAAGDFNGDKRADLAIGDSAEDIGGAQSAGGVVVLYGSQNGLQAAGSQLLAQGEGGALGASGSAEDFGIELAAADFNGDKLVDLAAADNDEDVGGTEDAGAVNVIFGSAGGLNPAAGQLLAQGVDGLAGVSGANEAFGTGLAAGRFDKGKLADLAIGDPSESVGGGSSAGAVNVAYGSPGGLSAGAGQLFAQGVGGLAGTSGDSESFGGELAAGDFDADKREDLAAGDPDEDVAGAESAGAVNALYGSKTGLGLGGSRLFAQGVSGLSGASEQFNDFGIALAAGDFDGDERADLAIGDSNEDVGADGAGAVTAVYGSKRGLKARGSGLLAQGVAGIAGASGDGDEFGSEVAAGDFDGDARADLAIGDSNDDAGAEGAGAVSAVYGSKRGLKAKGNQFLAQGLAGILGVSGPLESFGDELAG